MLCLADGLEAFLHQLAAVWSSGNTAAFPAGMPTLGWWETLPEALRTHVVPLAADHWAAADAFLFAGDAAGCAATFARIAALAGPLRPLCRIEPEIGDYPLWRLLVEQTVSINTAAAGGNAALVAGIE